MAKELSWFHEMLLNFILPRLLDMGGAELTKLLEKAYAENPDLIRTTVVSLYPFVDVYVEKFAAASKTKLDDDAVDELMDVIEAFALAHQIELPNLDTD